jgi:hypothetical protein
MNQRTRDAVAECDRIIDAVSRLRSALPELERRNRYAVGGDGYSSSSFGTSGQIGAVSQPTERAALQRPERDPVRTWTRDALRSLSKADRAAGDIDSLLTLLLGDYVCSDCGRNDAPRLVSGRCDTCRMRARRAVGS